MVENTDEHVGSSLNLQTIDQIVSLRAIEIIVDRHTEGPVDYSIIWPSVHVSTVHVHFRHYSGILQVTCMYSRDKPQLLWRGMDANQGRKSANHKHGRSFIRGNTYKSATLSLVNIQVHHPWALFSPGYLLSSLWEAMTVNANKLFVHVRGNSHVTMPTAL